MSARRGELWWVNLDPVQGHEQAGRRPALVLSVDAFNASGAELVTVLPVTTKARPGIPSRIEVKPPEGGLKGVSYVLAEQPRTISTSRLARRIGMVAPTTMGKVSDVVRMLLGL
jgi:mRNA interferase MazF